MENKQRNIGLDYLKGLAIIFVIARHVPLYQYDVLDGLNISEILQILFSLLSCGVPLFFTVNGYLLFKRNNLDLKKHVLKTIKIFFLTIVWAIFLLVINYLFDKTPLDRSQMIVLFLSTKAGSLYTGELWFLMSLFAIYMIYPILFYVYKNNFNYFLYFFLVVMGFNCGENLIEIIISFLNNPIHIEHLNNSVKFIGRFNVVVDQSWWLGYFMLGGLVYKLKDLLAKYKKPIIFLGLISCLLSFIIYFLAIFNNKVVAIYFNDSSIFEIFIILMYFVLFMQIKNNYIFLKQVGVNTFGIYVSHFYFIRIVRLFVSSDVFVTRFLILFLSLVISTIFSYTVKKIPYLKELVSL